MTIGIVGAGGWGTALARTVAVNCKEVLLWAREDAVRDEINSQHTNSSFLPGVSLPQNVRAIGDFAGLSVCDAVVLAVPSSYVRETAVLLRPHLRRGVPVADAAKGFELSTGLPLSAVLEEVFGGSHPVAAISGPNHAEEVGRGLPAATVVASQDESVAGIFQDALMTPAFRVYTSTDILGVELGGALKNIIALAAGITDGLGYGDNTKAALMTRGMTEIVRLGVSMGARRGTFAGLSGMGDLIATCTSPHSRNRRAGLALGQGKSLAEVVGGTNMVIEGVNATRAAHALSRKHGVRMPITDALYSVLFEGMDPARAVASLMGRAPKSEQGEDLAFSEV